MSTFGPLFIAVAIYAVSFFVGMTIFKHRKDRNGHRQAPGDRDDPDLAAITAGGLTVTFPVSEGSGTAASMSEALLKSMSLNEGSAPAPEIAETTADVPILGHKSASLMWHPGGRFTLAPYGGGTVAVDADARCHRSVFGSYFLTYPFDPAPKALTHEAPHLTCSCGFYALRHPDDLEPQSYGHVRLDVELSGRVIVHEKGYRAQHQRVLRAHVPGCYYCGEGALLVALLDSDDATTPRAVCETHKFKAAGEVSIPIEKVMNSIGLPWED